MAYLLAWEGYGVMLSGTLIAAKALRKEDGISYVLYRLCKEKEGINIKGQKCVARNIGVW